jgi:uncharacterized protein (TIGR00369 family)
MAQRELPSDPRKAARVANAHRGHYSEKLGIEFEEVGPERLTATMPVEGNTQPFGFLHGGATMSLIETLASFGAALNAGLSDRVVMGQQQTCNFISTATCERVRGVATPVHVGRTTHVWDVDVTDADTGKRIAAGRVTMAVRTPRA